MATLFANNASSRLAGSLAAGDTIIPLSAGDGSKFPALSAGANDFYVTLVGSTGLIEIARVTSRTGDNLTVVRGQDNTTAKAFTAGDRVEMRLVAKKLGDFEAVIAQAASLQTQVDARARLAGGNNFSGGQFITEGSLTLFSASAGVSPVLMMRSGVYAPTYRSSQERQRVEWVNSPGTKYTAWLTDGGALDVASQIRVGTVESAHKLLVQFYGGSNGNGIQMFPSVAGTVYPIELQNAGRNLVGSISTNDSGAAFNTTSDYRLKDEHGPVVGARVRLKNLKVFTGSFKVAPGVLRTMMYAHNIQEWMPHAVSGRKDAVDDDGKIIPQVVDYSAMVPDIIAAMLEDMSLSDKHRAMLLSVKAKQQQQDDLIAALADRLTALEAK